MHPLPTPPTYAKRKAGRVISAEIVDFELSFRQKARKSKVQKLGLAFEKKVLAGLIMELSGRLCPHPTFRFNNGTAYDQFAIPDVLHFDQQSGILTIFEIKLSHTADAFYQLFDLYRPVVAKAYPSFHLNLCEICRHYDRTVRLPEPPIFIDSLQHFCSSKQDKMGIFLWSRL